MPIGPLTKQRMETADEEFLAKTLADMESSVKAGKPFAPRKAYGVALVALGFGVLWVFVHPVLKLINDRNPWENSDHSFQLVFF